MKMEKYQALSERTQGPGLTPNEALCNAALGLAGEAGECVDIVKKHVFHGHDLDGNKLIEEMGDVLFYLAWMASELGVSLAYVAEMNVEKLKRRYPDGFSHEASVNRDDNGGA